MQAWIQTMNRRGRERRGGEEGGGGKERKGEEGRLLLLGFCLYCRASWDRALYGRGGEGGEERGMKVEERCT